ncbi:retrotransposon protein, putative, ty1-copia subclass [Tanacetum coccineum]
MRWQISSGRKKSRGSNSGDGGNMGDEGKTVGGAMGACGGGIGDSLLVALYAYMTFIYGSSWKGEMIGTSLRGVKKRWRSGFVHQGGDKRFAWSARVQGGKKEASMEMLVFATNATNSLTLLTEQLEQMTLRSRFLPVGFLGLFECSMELSQQTFLNFLNYSHQVERAKDLLGLIHTDVYGPFKIVSRQGASYFVTFTDDFSRYGYVCLLKHKHKVFETFKVFQKDVETQLGKTIKSLRSDRGGEYISQEFLDHLKEHEIIAHRTPPYTPQHNGVSERRNRTLLDMVRSMMSQTTLPKSFWDYALETAIRILNMTPTKKVDKTPYEVWHGQAPKLSYLKVYLRRIPKETMGYSFYSPSENKVFVARNAEFFENDLIGLKASGSVEDLEIIQEEDINPSVDTSLNHEEDDQEIDEPQSDINP